MKPDRTHYSYTVYADASHAEAFDEARFSGAIGELVAADQLHAVLAMAGEIGGRTVLDIGAGTGRVSLELARRGAIVTALDASPEMLRVAERKAVADGLVIAFEQGDAHELPCEAASFDVALSLRVLMHAVDWRACVAEACRVARTTVILDFPARWSFASLQALWRRLLHFLVWSEGQAYRTLTLRQVRRALRQHGYEIVARHRQFVLPIALHRRLDAPRWSVAIERALARAGLLHLFGSPVTVAGVRGGTANQAHAPRS